MVLKEIINKGVITMDQFQSNTIETSRKPGKHLTLDERGIIQALHQQRHSLRYIATIVGCAHTIIYNEIWRGTPKPKSNHERRPQYTAKRGQKAYEEHRKHSRKPLKITVMIANHVPRHFIICSGPESCPYPFSIYRGS